MRSTRCSLTMFFNSLTVLAVLLTVDKCLAHWSCHQNSKIPLLDEYDFVIVGAGSAGSVVANRLSEIDDVTVLLLEAGGEEDPILNEIPRLTGTLVNSYQDWKFVTEDQDGKYFRNNSKKLNYVRGKVLGGSSSVNSMIYMRGNRNDYEAWNKDVKSGWSWDKVLSFFQKSEENQATTVDELYHGTDGLLTVTETSARNSLSDIILTAANEIGLQTRDVNGKQQTGIMPGQYTIRNGARCSTNKAFLKSAANRKNLHILTDAYVLKVVIEKSRRNKIKATGVIFQCGKHNRTVDASKEVILSAGTINTPQLLLLSGIGPEQQLKKFQIPVNVNLPGVGENFRDHLVLNAIHIISNKTDTENACPPTTDFQAQLLEWAFDRTGPLTTPLGPPDVIGFSSTKKEYRDIDWPNVQFTFMSPFPVEGEVDNREVSSSLITLMRTRNSGFVRLASADPVAPPVIDPRFLSDESDLDDLVEAVKICLSFADTAAFKSAGLSVKIHSYQACASYDKLTDDYLKCAVQQMLNPGWHCVGTCKMGNSHDEMAVVDSQLRVFNVSNLRVIDASIMPQTPSGNTNAPTIMVAESGADFIKQYWR